MEGIRNIVTAALKTFSSTAVGAFAAWLLSLGIDLGEHTTLVESALFAILVAASNALINLASQKWPVVAQVFSFGLAKEAPTYDKAA